MGFRNDFVWGAATSAYQIEGGAYEDGKGLNIFDTFCSIPGRILNNDTGNTACDHYHRWKEDIALMKRIGIKAYRFLLTGQELYLTEPVKQIPMVLNSITP